MQLLHTVGERCRAGLKDVGRLDLKDSIRADSTHVMPSISFSDRLLLDRASTPRGNDDLGIALDDVCGGNYALRRRLLFTKLREDRRAAGDLNQLIDPANARNQWIIPLFKEDSGPT